MKLTYHTFFWQFKPLVPIHGHWGGRRGQKPPPSEDLLSCNKVWSVPPWPPKPTFFSHFRACRLRRPEFLFFLLPSFSPLPVKRSPPPGSLTTSSFSLPQKKSCPPPPPQWPPNPCICSICHVLFFSLVAFPIRTIMAPIGNIRFFRTRMDTGLERWRDQPRGTWKTMM